MREQLSPGARVRLAELLHDRPTTVDAAAQGLVSAAAELQSVLRHQGDDLDAASFATVIAPSLECLADVMSQAYWLNLPGHPGIAWWERAADDAAHIHQDVRNAGEVN